MATYTTVDGHEIEYDESRSDEVAFLKRILKLAHAGGSEDELITLVYSSENPILGPYPFGGRGAVTKETLEHPLYLVMTDVVFRSRLARTGESVEHFNARYTLPVTEAAKRLGISRSAMHKAVQERRIGSCVRKGQYYLRPDDVDRFATELPETRRGIAPKTQGPGAPLEVRIGINPAVQFAVKAPEELKSLEHDGGKAMRGVIRAGWSSIAVGYQSRLNDKPEEGFWVLTPSDTDNELELTEFYIRGRFKVKKKRMGKTSRDEYEAFEAM